MKTNEKTYRTIGVTNLPSHSDSAPVNARRVSSWPDRVATPPFTVSGTAAISAKDLVGNRVEGDRRCDIAAIGVTLLEDGVTILEGGVTHRKPRQARTWFAQIDAALIAMDWIAMDLPHVEVLHLFLGRRSESGPDEPLSLPTWRAAATARRWSVMPLTLGTHDAVGVFRSREARDSQPAWVWHHLAASVLLRGTHIVQS